MAGEVVAQPRDKDRDAAAPIDAGMSTPNVPSVAPLMDVRERLEAQLRDVDFVAGLERAAEAAARVRRGALVARELVWDVISDTYLRRNTALGSGSCSVVGSRHDRGEEPEGPRAAPSRDDTSLLDLGHEIVQAGTPEAVNDAAPWLVDPADLPAFLG
jgi:hypothetical protein